MHLVSNCIVNISCIYQVKIQSKKYQPGMKLNDKKIKYIIRNRSVLPTQLYKEIKISVRYVNYIYKKYKENGDYIIGSKRNKQQ
jgi:hypothetical protein